MSRRKPPSYGRKLDRGVERARVTLFCSVTRRRIDIYLGRYGSPESRQAYARIVAEWEASNRAVRRTEGQRRLQAPGLTVNQLLSQFWPAAQQTYSRGELAPLKLVVRMLRDHCGYMAAAVVGPNTFRGMRHLMIEQRLARTTINKQMRRAVAIFRWGVAHELVSPLTHQALSTLEPLKRGRTEAPELEPVRPVRHDIIEVTKRHVPQLVARMIELQVLTGMRSGELLAMRPCDLTMTDAEWSYAPERHKTWHHGHTRIVHFGPRAREILRPLLGSETTERLFARYTRDSYRRAITRGCDLAEAEARAKAGLPPAWSCSACNKSWPIYDDYRRHCLVRHEQKLGPEPKTERLVPRWFPHQLRHTYATDVRRLFGLEAAQVALGHRSLDVTLIYAERDAAMSKRVAEQIG